MKKVFLAFWIIVLTLSSFSRDNGASAAQQADTVKINTELFGSDELLEINLKFDITEYRRKKSDTEYLDAVLSYSYKGDSITEKLKLRSRGIFRRNYCEMPPIMLNFRKSSDKGVFAHINKLKMVTECPQGNKEYLLREYLTYRLYNKLTDNSFRVRLVKVNYINTAKKGKSFTEYAFFIEPEEFLASRMNAVELNVNITQKQVKPEMMDRMAIFNYMIGNTDWSVPISHNIKLFAEHTSSSRGLAIIVPYDFDFSGLVYTNYSAPFEGLKITSVRQRLYLGICRNKETLLLAFHEFEMKKQDFMDIVNEFPYLTERSKKDMTAYLESFYKELSKPESLARVILGECINF
jgi:hypothetical protein